MGERPAALQVEALRKRIGSGAGSFWLEAEFKIQAAERVCVLGPSGCGKTTLFRLIAGLMPFAQDDSGRVRLGDEDLTQATPESRRFGLVTQDPALLPSLSVAENAAFGLRMRGVGRRARLDRVMPWLDRVGLAHRAGDSIRGLSGGERQRIAFVRALIFEPRLLLLDEPFSAVDADRRAELREALVSLHREWPVPCLLVSHDRDDVASLATDHITVQSTGDASAGLAVRRFLRG